MPPIPRALTRPIVATLLFLSLTGLGGLDSLFAPKPELWQRWAVHQAGASQTLDHSGWDRLLNTRVATDASGLNRVAYNQFTDADKTALKAYLNDLSVAPVSRLARPEQRAFWINAYNALALNVVLENKPEKSIQDVDLGGGGLFSSGPWSAKLITVEGEDLSLNDIEHRILRPIWKDPRLHYAVNCASISCPNLQRRAFTAANTEAMLDAAAAQYINNPRGVRIADGGLVLSKIYSWFVDDFGGDEAGVLAHLKKYARGALAEKLSQNPPIVGFEYDWGLNASTD